MEEDNFNNSLFGEICRLARRNFEATLAYYERDEGYESGDEFDTDEPDNNVNNLKGDEG